MWEGKETINNLNVFCAEMSNRPLGDTGVSLTMEGKAGDSQAHPCKVSWDLSWQWIPRLTGL
jgi:hypothetical protein